AERGTVGFPLPSAGARRSRPEAVSRPTPPSPHSHSPHSYFQSGSSGCSRSQSGRRLWTVGTCSKLYEGGGDVVAHSSVQARHGLSPAGWPFHSDATMLYAKIAKLGTWMIAPSVLSWFQIVQGRSGS